ncbi:MAG: ATPase, T2SS/T4P/T4SS family [Cytophagales bacterium]|nr:ATPase, T2SS/T4P/T4SS family [Cytophagales bacterium]
MSDLRQGAAALEQHMSQVILPAQLGDLYRYFDLPDVQEIMINDPTNIWIEKSGLYQKLDMKLDASRVTGVITTIANLNQTGNGGESKLLNCRLPGLRIAAALAPISHLGPSMSIRRHSARVFDLDHYVASGAFDAHWPQPKDGRKLVTLSRPERSDIAKGGVALKEMFQHLIYEHYNQMLCGSTSSGKTTLLNAMAREIPHSDRLLTIEEPHELQIIVPNWVGFEANASLGVNTRDLVKHALRYRPNRIMVGEVRGAEAFDVLDAYNTGHPGSGFSMHSDSALMGLYRFENMVRMAPEASNWPLHDLRRQIAATFPYVIHAATVDGARGPSELIQVMGINERGEYEIESLFKKSNPNT